MEQQKNDKNILVCFDIETTGLDRQNDQIIQFSAVKVDRTTWEILDTLNLKIKPYGNWSMTYPAYYKHHILPKDLDGCPYLRDVAKQIIKFFGHYDTLTYNGSGFDIVFLQNDLAKYGFSIDFLHRNNYDAFQIQQEHNSNKLSEVYKRITGEDQPDQHDAFSDVKATVEVFKTQEAQWGEQKPLKMYGEDNVISDRLFEGHTEVCFNIGKYASLPVRIVNKFDPGYIRWACGSGCHFTPATKRKIVEICG